jgi:SAM-dependent methyltransferase
MAPAAVIDALREPTGPDAALVAYEALAPVYDRFTEDYDYPKWLDGIEHWALAHGLEGRQLLDVACGTGKSFAPMLARRYQVTACDISPAMVLEARKNLGARARVVVADMRALPWASSFDFVTCLDDAVNYLLSKADLDAALTSMARTLRPGGVLVFDTNSLATYRSAFAQTFEVTSGDWRFTWRGEADANFKRGGLASATIEASGPEPLSPSRHIQRHWSPEVIASACRRAGFQDVLFRGQVTGAQLLGEPDEEKHTKILCLAVKRRLRAVRWNARTHDGSLVAKIQSEGAAMVIKA